MTFAQSTLARARPLWKKVIAYTPRRFERLDELSKVRAVATVSDRFSKVAPGAIGTIVHVYEGGKAFEVEFDAPSPAILFTERCQIEAA